MSVEHLAADLPRHSRDTEDMTVHQFLLFGSGQPCPLQQQDRGLEQG